MATYKQISDRPTQDKLYQRYRTEIASLKLLGFRHLSYCLEDHGTFSALKHSLAALLALSNNEIIQIKWPFRLMLANVLMAAENPPTVALCMGLGIKLYTPFEDGTVMISSDFQSHFMPSGASEIIRLPSRGSLAATWEEHRRQAQELSNKTKYREERMTFGDYMMMSAIEEDAANFP